MSVLAVFELRGVTGAQLRHVDAELDGTPLGGRLLRLQAPTADGWLLVELWRSEADLDRHTERWVPALIRAGIEPPAPGLFNREKENDMAIAVKYEVHGMSAAKYDDILRELDEMGEGAPAGRRYHVAYGDGHDLQVIDVFERPDQLEAFGGKIMPILQKHGVTARPEVLPAHNVIAGG